MKKIITIFIFLTSGIYSHAQPISIVSYGAIIGSSFSNANSNATINTNAIQTAINNNPGKRILIPAGYYVINASINISNNIELVGEGKGITNLQALNCDGVKILIDQVMLKDFSLIGSSNNSTVYKGINIGSSNRINFIDIQNIRIQSFIIGIQMLNGWDVKIGNCDLDVNANLPQIDVAIKIIGQSVNNMISNCHIIANSVGIWSLSDPLNVNSKPEGIMITNCLISLAKNSILAEATLSIHVSNCILDLNRGYAICFRNSSGGLVTNNWIYSGVTSGSPIDQAISIESSMNCNISNNNIITATGARTIGITAYSNNIAITGNQIEIDNGAGYVAVFDNTTYAIILSNNILKRKILVNQPTSFINNLSTNYIVSNNLNITVP